MAPKSPWKKKATVNGQVPQSTTSEPAASSTIKYDEVQSEEIEALKAIYMDDYEDVEIKGAWRTTTDRSFRLKLRASSDPESSCLLSVRFTATYPKSAPLLVITHLQDFHPRTQQRINNVVSTRPKQLLGEVMIYEISSNIQDALEDAVLARQQGTLPSLDVERASAGDMAAALAHDEELAEALQQREALEEKARTMRVMVERELTRREQRSSTTTRSTDADEHAYGPYEEVVTFDQPATLNVGNEVLQFNIVSILGFISEKRDESLKIGKPRVPGVQHAQLVAVRQLKTQRSRSEIIEIEVALEALRTLRHNSILGVLAFRVDKLGENLSCVTLCSEYAGRGTLEDQLRMGNLHASTARQFTIELLEALDYLHHNGVAHGCVGITSIFIVNAPIVTAKLGALGRWVLKPDFKPLSTTWQAPETDTPSLTTRRRCDIWCLGAVILQMFVGVNVVVDHASPLAVRNHFDFSDAFDDLVRKIFVIDPAKRPSAFSLLPSEFLRTDATVMEDAPVTSNRSLYRHSADFASPAERRSRRGSTTLFEPVSRYTTEFTELGRLGKGGFGEVVKARNKIDGGVYAVKKIKQTSQLLDKVLSEVILLNRLNHPFVVRYHGAWIENDVPGASIADEASTTEETATTAEDDNTREDDESEETSIDLARPSGGGLDFISASGPHIEFGEDSEPGSDIFEREDHDEQASSDGTQNDTDTPEANRPQLKKTRSASQRLPSILFIQMEYCEKRTLRDLIRKGMSVDDTWRYVRQIVEGLAHIHGHGIIHRDLKPDNVFVDVSLDLKIGDFGLATTGQYQSFSDQTSLPSGPSDDMTKSVGTALYVAPELRSGSGSTYNDKVDIYSLGIIFFEMCETFETGMGRVTALSDLRKKETLLPPDFLLGGKRATQGKLILCLIAHRPSERPSSKELLRSDLMPAKVEDEAIRQALIGLNDVQSPYHERITAALFTQDPTGTTEVKAHAWDAKPNGITEEANKLRARAVARMSLESVFRVHGAEETRRQTVFPRSEYYPSTQLVQLLDTSGSLLQLPYDLMLPHARQAARQMPAVRKAYAFGTAYRAPPTGGPPRLNDEVDFDITSSSGSDNFALDDAEVMKVVDELTCALPSLDQGSAVSFHLNHADILDAVLDVCNIATSQRAVVKETVSRLGFHQHTWTKVRADLRRIGLPDTTLDDLEQFNIRDVPEKAFARLQKRFEAASVSIKATLERALQSLTTILHLLAQMSMQRKIFITPLGSVNAKFYAGGMLFQCVLERKPYKSVIAAGGRYDSLIRAHKPVDGPAACRGAVGVSIAMDPIIGNMLKAAGGSSKSAFLHESTFIGPLAKRCDVQVVNSGTDGAQLASIKLLSSLWANDISAELVDASRNLADETPYSLVVNVRHEASNTVRVRPAASDVEETDVPMTSLVGYIKQELRERETTKAKQPPSFGRQTSHHEADGDQNVKVLYAQHKSKKTNRNEIVKTARQTWAENLEAMKEAPILAVEMRDEVLEMIRETRLSNAESWRKAVQNAPLSEVQYLQGMQDNLRGFQRKWKDGDGDREAAIFNFRTGSCVKYDLGA